MKLSNRALMHKKASIGRLALGIGGGALAGGLAGLGQGYLSDSENKTTDVLTGAGLGALAGLIPSIGMVETRVAPIVSKAKPLSKAVNKATSGGGGSIVKNVNSPAVHKANVNTLVRAAQKAKQNIAKANATGSSLVGKSKVQYTGPVFKPASGAKNLSNFVPRAAKRPYSVSEFLNKVPSALEDKIKKGTATFHEQKFYKRSQTLVNRLNNGGFRSHNAFLDELVSEYNRIVRGK